MFSELLKRRVAKCLVWVMILTNISPVFSIGLEHADYSIRVERSIRLNPITKNEELGLQLSVHEFEGKGYRTVMERFLSSFADFSGAESLLTKQQTQLAQRVTLQNSQAEGENVPQDREKAAENQAQLTEVLEKLNVRIRQPEKEEDEYYEIGKRTDVSRGFCLNIPELGDILVSHEGDVVFDNSFKKIQKSLRISAPSHVILNGAKAEEIEVEATAAYLTEKSHAEIRSLRFTGRGEAGSFLNGLFVDCESELKVSELAMENALLVNAGRLVVGEQLNLNRGCVFNGGNLLSSAKMSVFENISYMFNSSKGSVNSSGKLILGVDNFANLGTFRSEFLSMVIADSFNNSGTIESSKRSEISVIGEAINVGRIDGKGGDLVISAPKILHENNVSISASKVDFLTKEAELLGEVRAQEAIFRGKTKVEGNVRLGHGVISDGVFINKSAEANFEKLELTGRRSEVKNEENISAGAILGNAKINTISGEDIAVNEIQATHRTEIGLKLDAIYVLLRSSEAITSFGDSRLQAVPKMRMVEEESLLQRVNDVVELVGREKFYLTVGKVLHKIGATVGLKPDGVVTKGERERADKGLEDSRGEGTGGGEARAPGFQSFCCGVCGHDCEVSAFKRIQAQVELQQIKEGKSSEDREKTRRKVARYIAAVKEEEKVEQKRARETAEEIIKNDACLKSEVSRVDSNKKKAHILANEIIRVKLAGGLSPKLYSKQVLFKDPKSGQMFRVIQRNDIDPNKAVPKGSYKGKTNLKAMKGGRASYTIGGE